MMKTRLWTSPSLDTLLPWSVTSKASRVVVQGHEIIFTTLNLNRIVAGAVAGLQEGLSFSTPFLYDGLKFAGDEFYITQCIDKGLKHWDECSGVKACILEFSTHMDIVGKTLPERKFVMSDKESLMSFSQFEGLKNGTCNVMAHESLRLIPQVAYYMGAPQPYAVSQNYYSKEPLAIVTKSHDPEFSDFVDSIMQALLVADKYNITQATADDFPQTTMFGEAYKDMFRNAIRVAGNYNELYQRFLQQYIPRSSLNLLNNGSTGLLYSLPFGDLGGELRDLNIYPLGNLTQEILDRQHIRCGIRPGRDGFVNKTVTADGEVVYSGMEVDLCSAVAAGLFHDMTAVEFVELGSTEEGYRMLADNQVDVVAGALWRIGSDVREPTTGLGFSFSQPYFYGYSEEEDNLALATRQEDHDWEAIVFWTVSALFYAEAQGIQQHQYNQMPSVSLFGERLERIFKDAILYVGNYGELYQRNVGSVFPRSGRNELNSISNAGPQYYAIPGFFD